MFSYKNWKQKNETEVEKNPDEGGVQRAPTNLKELDFSSLEASHEEVTHPVKNKPLASLSRQSSSKISEEQPSRISEMIRDLNNNMNIEAASIKGD